MGRYRKKPVEIEAIQFVKDRKYPAGTNIADLIRFVEGGGGEVVVRPPGVLGIVTLEGTMAAGVGDWIIRGVQGEFYPCKPDIFDATYEPV